MACALTEWDGDNRHLHKLKSFPGKVCLGIILIVSKERVKSGLDGKKMRDEDDV